MSAGLGLVLILRWFWWRVNAWTEITALASSLVTIFILILYTKSAGVPLQLKHQIIIIPVSILSWLIATYLTKPEPQETLNNFYRKIRPWGFWGPVTKMNPDVVQPPFKPLIINWALGVIFIFFLMIGIGKLLLGSPYLGAGMITVSICAGIGIYLRIRKA